MSDPWQLDSVRRGKNEVLTIFACIDCHWDFLREQQERPAESARTPAFYPSYSGLCCISCYQLASGLNQRALATHVSSWPDSVSKQQSAAIGLVRLTWHRNPVNN